MVYSSSSDGAFDREALRRPAESALLSRENLSYAAGMGGTGAVMIGGAAVGIAGGAMLAPGFLLAGGIAFVGTAVASLFAGAAKTTASTLVSIEPLFSPLGLASAPICGLVSSPNFSMTDCIAFSQFDAWQKLADAKLDSLMQSERLGDGWNAELSLLDEPDKDRSEFSLLDPSSLPGAPQSNSPTSTFEQYKSWERDHEQRQHEKILLDIEKAGNETGTMDERPFNAKGDADDSVA